MCLKIREIYDLELNLVNIPTQSGKNKHLDTAKAEVCFLRLINGAKILHRKCCKGYIL